jgi:hypothetical protein
MSNHTAVCHHWNPYPSNETGSTGKENGSTLRYILSWRRVFWKMTLEILLLLWKPNVHHGVQNRR